MKKMNPENKKQRQKGVKERAENKRDKGVRKEKVMGKEREGEGRRGKER